MKNATPQQRIAAFWKDYERFGSVWSLECTLVLHFGRHPELLLPQAQEYRNVTFGYDPCLPQEDDPDHGYFELFVDAAERIIESRIRTADGGLDERLCGYPGGRRVDGGLNMGWSQPFQRIEASGDLKDELIAELKAATTRDGVRPLSKPTQRSLELHT